MSSSSLFRCFRSDAGSSDDNEHVWSNNSSESSLNAEPMRSDQDEATRGVEDNGRSVTDSAPGSEVAVESVEAVKAEANELMEQDTSQKPGEGRQCRRFRSHLNGDTQPGPSRLPYATLNVAYPPEALSLPPRQPNPDPAGNWYVWVDPIRGHHQVDPPHPWEGMWRLINRRNGTMFVCGMDGVWYVLDQTHPWAVQRNRGEARDRD